MYLKVSKAGPVITLQQRKPNSHVNEAMICNVMSPAFTVSGGGGGGKAGKAGDEAKDTTHLPIGMYIMKIIRQHHHRRQHLHHITQTLTNTQKVSLSVRTTAHTSMWQQLLFSSQRV